MYDEAHQLVDGAWVPRPEDVAAAVGLQVVRNMGALPTTATETTVPEGTLLTAALRWAVRDGVLREDVALRLAVYAAAAEPVPV